MTAFTQSAAARLNDRDYFDFVLASAESSQRRLWVSMFIFDIRPSRDLEGLVLDLATALVDRARFGVDVRALTTGAVGTPDIAVANLASGLYLVNAGVRHRRVFANGDGRIGSHAKFIIADEVAVLGSQNWTDDGFRQNIEEAAILTGQATELVAQEFLRLWALARGMPQHGAD